MKDLKKIIWLASYPKSGNTWFRAFLTAFLNPSRVSIDINKLYPTTIASNRQLFDEMTGVSSADLTLKEIEHLRARVYLQNALESDKILYYKVHDAWIHTLGYEPMFPENITKAVLYFIRNPLDVAVSFAHHQSQTIYKIVEIMNNREYEFCPRIDRLYDQLRQRLLSWSSHVKSWVDDSGLPVLVLRYEDMKANPVATFKHAVSFIGLQASGEEVKTALAQSSFDLLKQQEAEKGFSERSPKAESFFRKGVVGEWKNVLTPGQVKRIVDAHGEVMGRFGYLEDSML